ncbi:MAG: hypothetical protein JSW42_08585, partial [Chloroflexota bacterium]
MAVTSETLTSNRERFSTLISRVSQPFVMVPILGWFFGALVAVLLEQFIGLQIARGLGMPRIPALFGISIALQNPALIPSAILYDILIYILPITLIARISATPANWLSGRLFDFRSWLSVLFHIALLYGIVHIWSGVSDYRTLVIRLIMIAILWTLSL